MSPTYWEYICKSHELWSLNRCFWVSAGIMPLSWKDVYILVCFNFTREAMPVGVYVKSSLGSHVSAWQWQMTLVVLLSTWIKTFAEGYCVLRKDVGRIDIEAAVQSDKEIREKGVLFSTLLRFCFISKLGWSKGDFFPSYDLE